MKVKYDKFNDLFWVDGKELFWSSVYVLRQKEITLKSLLKRLKISKSEESLFSEELDDLRALKFISGKNKIKTTKKGKEFLKEVEKKIQFKHLREKGIEDIDDVFVETNKVMHLNPKKSKLLLKHNWKPETVEWFSLFLNTTVGFIVFFLLLLGFFFGMGSISLDALIVQMVFAPIGAIMVMGMSTVLLWIFYHGGSALGYLFFRHR